MTRPQMIETVARKTGFTEAQVEVFVITDFTIVD